MREVKHEVIYQIKGGKWEDKTKDPIVEYVYDNCTPSNIPTSMIRGKLRVGDGSWDEDPYSTPITEDTVFTYKFKRPILVPILIGCFALVLLCSLAFLNNGKPIGVENKKENVTVAEKVNYTTDVKEAIDFDDVVVEKEEEKTTNPVVSFFTNAVDTIFGNDEPTNDNTNSGSTTGGNTGGGSGGSQTVKYTITWKDDEGNVIDTTQVNKGSYPAHANPAKEGYTFVRWNPSIVAATSNATYEAVFEEDAPVQYTILVSVNDENMGTVTGGGTYDEGTEITLNAIANEGYHFVRWEDGETNPSRTITVSEDSAAVTYSVIFEQDVPELEMPTEGSIITLNDGNPYRILKYDDNGNALVLGNDATGVFFNDGQILTEFVNINTGNTVEQYAYAGSNLDNYLENVWYENLKQSHLDMYNAIVLTSIEQHNYTYSPGSTSGNKVATGYYVSGSGNTEFYKFYNVLQPAQIGDRHVFVLDIKDIIDYLGTYITPEKLQEMFSNNTDYIWLRTTCSKTNVLQLNLNRGSFSTVNPSDTLVYHICPAFYIDLLAEGVTFEIIE